MPEPYYADDAVTVHVGDCRKVLPQVLADNSVDAIVCDPPYELGFMGRGWDASGVAFDPVTWRECLRVLKPGGHLLAFGGTRTWHRLMVAIEDAGWEIRDTLMWIYGSGFPKSLDVSKAIDKAAGATREVVGVAADFARDGATRKTDGSHVAPHSRQGGHRFRPSWDAPVTAPASSDARAWDGWGTALKPGWEPIILARKPLAGTVVETVVEYGTGVLNIDGCRVDTHSEGPGTTPPSTVNGVRGSMAGPMDRVDYDASKGRWPANLVFSHGALCVEDGRCQPDCPVAELDRQSGNRPGGAFPGRTAKGPKFSGATYNGGREYDGRVDVEPRAMGDSGGASRFFPTFRYSAKASSSERPKLDDGTAHATVKPLALIRWLIRLVTPPGGLVLDPFGGSGTTGEAAVIEGFRAVLVELEHPHAELIRQRLAKPIAPTLDLGGDVA